MLLHMNACEVNFLDEMDCVIFLFASGVCHLQY